MFRLAEVSGSRASFADYFSALLLTKKAIAIERVSYLRASHMELHRHVSGFPDRARTFVGQLASHGWFLLDRDIGDRAGERGCTFENERDHDEINCSGQTRG